MDFRPPSKPSLFCQTMGRDGAGEGSPDKVDKVATTSREVKMEDYLYSFSIFVGFFPQ